MNSILKIAVFGIGGISLFAGTYVGIAAISGAPMHEVAGLSSFFDAPETGEAIEGQPESTAEGEAAPETDGQKLLEENAGLLGGFMIESPFTGTEMRNLVSELKKQMREMRVERERLAVRELELDEREQALRERQAQLADQRTMLEDLETTIALSMGELEHAETVQDEKDLQALRQMAKLYDGDDETVNVLMLTEESPADAAVILRELGDKKAAGLLRLITPASERRKFMDAYRQLLSEPIQ